MVRVAADWDAVVNVAPSVDVRQRRRATRVMRSLKAYDFVTDAAGVRAGLPGRLASVVLRAGVVRRGRRRRAGRRQSRKAELLDTPVGPPHRPTNFTPHP